MVMDEATSNIDYATDAIIQRTLRESPLCRSKTLLIIAHRLATVITCDQIVVLDQGKVVESGSPRDLLEIKTSFTTDGRKAEDGEHHASFPPPSVKSGFLSRLVENTGTESAKHLRELALTTRRINRMDGVE